MLFGLPPSPQAQCLPSKCEAVRRNGHGDLCWIMWIRANLCWGRLGCPGSWLSQSRVAAHHLPESAPESEAIMPLLLSYWMRERSHGWISLPSWFHWIGSKHALCRTPLAKHPHVIKQAVINRQPSVKSSAPPANILMYTR